MEMYDVIIIGGGPGGLSAAIYASRHMLTTLLLEKGVCGGLLLETPIIENFPGFPDGVSGGELAERLKHQAEKFGTKINEFEEAKEITLSTQGIRIDGGRYCARALIMASGGTPKRLEIPGEEEYRGRGLSYCAVCDGPLYKEREVVVIGGGDGAVAEALFLTRFVKGLTLIHRRDRLRATRILQERLRKSENVKFLWNSEPVKILGSRHVEGIRVLDKERDEEFDIPCEGIFVFLGLRPNTHLLKGIVELDQDGYVITDEWMRTSSPGIFACGDCRRRPLHQVITACGEGAIAATSAKDYLER